MKHRSRPIAALVAALTLLVGVSTLGACTPEEVALFQTLTPSEQDAVLVYLGYRAPSPSVDCYQAIDRHWPASGRAKARQIVWRESRNIPTARNPRSSAKGCAQLLMSYHSWRYTAVGCSPSQWANPDCNIKAALHLYREAGWRPWAV